MKSRGQFSRYFQHLVYLRLIFPIMRNLTQETNKLAHAFTNQWKSSRKSRLANIGRININAFLPHQLIEFYTCQYFFHLFKLILCALRRVRAQCLPDPSNVHKFLTPRRFVPEMRHGPDLRAFMRQNMRCKYAGREICNEDFRKIVCSRSNKIAHAHARLRERAHLAYSRGRCD